MKFAMTKIAAAAVLASAAMSAQAVDFASMTVTGGTFSMAGAGGSFIAANLTPGLDLLAGNNQDVNVAGLLPASVSVANPLFNFGFFGPVGAFLTDGSYMPYGGAAAGGSATAPTASETGGVMTADLSAWTAYWNGTNFGQGGIATGTWDSVTGEYSIGWSATVVGGSFDGMTGVWNMTGVAVPVPEASTYGMMLAGLGLVGFAVRRRKLI